MTVPDQIKTNSDGNNHKPVGVVTFGLDRPPFAPVVLGDVPAEPAGTLDQVARLTAELDATRALLLPTLPPRPPGPPLDYVPAGDRPAPGPVQPIIGDQLAAELNMSALGSVGD